MPSFTGESLTLIAADSGLKEVLSRLPAGFSGSLSVEGSLSGGRPADSARRSGLRLFAATAWSDAQGTSPALRRPSLLNLLRANAFDRKILELPKLASEGPGPGGSGEGPHHGSSASLYTSWGSDIRGQGDPKRAHADPVELQDNICMMTTSSNRLASCAKNRALRNTPALLCRVASIKCENAPRYYSRLLKISASTALHKRQQPKAL